jgi:glycosyltransferase involved in cell wall biosynthesis
MLTPLPPVKSGVAVYAAMIAPSLAKRVDLTLVSSEETSFRHPSIGTKLFDEWTPDRGEIVVAQLGNNPFHEFAWRYVLEHDDCVVVLHDLVLHHLIVEATLARGDGSAYEASLLGNHGERGAAIARARARGIHHEIANFLYPGFLDVTSRARAVVVHNRWAGAELRRHGVKAPIVVVDHPHAASAQVPNRESARVKWKLADRRVISMLGFVTSAKRPEVVFETFARAAKGDERLHLWIVGEAAPNVDLHSLARRHGVDASRWSTTGFVTDEEFDEAIAASDAIVNLRYPTAGESSGPLTRVFAAGRPIAVSAISQFAELPDELVVKIPLGAGEVAALERFMLSARIDGTEQQEWLDEHGDPEGAVEGYLRAIEGDSDFAGETADAISAIAYARDFAIEWKDDSLLLTNHGPTLRARGFGSPALQLVVKWLRGAEEIRSEWLELPGDVRRGESVSIPLARNAGADRLVVESALQGIPDPFPRVYLDRRLR